MPSRILRAVYMLLVRWTRPRRRRTAIPPLLDPDPLLDLTAFPHLLDLVIAASEPRELMILRRTSKYARSRADAALFAHVAVIPFAYPELQYLMPDMSNRLPLKPFSDIDRSAKLAHTRALDIYPAGVMYPPGFANCEFHQPRFTDWLCKSWPKATLAQNPSIVRRAHPAARHHPPTTTFVDYVDLTEHHPQLLEYMSASGEYTHYVLHLVFAQRSDFRSDGFRLYFPSPSHGVESITLVLLPKGEAEGDYANLEGDCFDALFPNLLQFEPWLEGGARLTIVGAERCHPLHIGLLPGPPIESRCQRRRRRGRGYIGGVGKAGEDGYIHLGGISEADDGGMATPAALQSTLQSAIRSRVHEIMTRTWISDSPSDTNPCWNRSEVDRDHEVAETTLVETLDDWRARQDPLVAQWRPPLSGWTICRPAPYPAVKRMKRKNN